jgi:adenylate kinase
MSLKNNKKVVIIMGAPGSGKGTQSELVSDRLSLYYLETSKVIESNIMKIKGNETVVISGKKYSLKQEKTNWETGILNSPLMVSFWMKEKIKRLADEGESLILAGSPRTMPEAEELTPFLKKLYGTKNIKVVLLDISAKESIFRNSHRKICELMRHPVLYSQETDKLKSCPLDGSKLLKRKGLDDPKTIIVRLKQYKDRTLPVISYLKKQGISVKKINGSPAPAIVFKNILKALK